VLAEAVRRIGLGEELHSGRTRIDIRWALNQLNEPDMAQPRPAPPDPEAVPALLGAVGDIAAAAIRAPSGGNTQPWNIEAAPAGITILLAPGHTAAMDVAFRGSAVALVAALLNARIAAAAHHILGPTSLTQHEDGSRCAPPPTRPRHGPQPRHLYHPMLARETNRHHGTPTPLDDDTIKLLATVAEHEGARLQLLTTKDDIARAATILAAADRTRYLTPACTQT
jgi:hypothetical protein